MSDTPTSSQTKSPALSQSSAAPSASSISHTPTIEGPESAKPRSSRALLERLGNPHLRQPRVRKVCSSIHSIVQQANCFEVSATQSNGVTNGIKNIIAEDADESIYHLPSGLQDLLQSFEATQRRVSNAPSQSSQRMLASSLSSHPDMLDVSAPRNTSPRSDLIRLCIILKN